MERQERQALSLTGWRGWRRRGWRRRRWRRRGYRARRAWSCLIRRICRTAAPCDSNDDYRGGPEEKVSTLHGATYVKITPDTVPTVAVPSDRRPVVLRVIPGGSAAPVGSIPNVPPRGIAGGSVELRLKVAPVPTINVGMTGVQGVVGAVDEVISSRAPPHPARVVNATANPCFSKHLRLKSTSMNSKFAHAHMTGGATCARVQR